MFHTSETDTQNDGWRQIQPRLSTSREWLYSQQTNSVITKKYITKLK